ncbi:arylamine N-acetyltransferase, partial [Nostoc sp. NIES-2111]
RATAGVNRREKGAAALGNHLTLLVDLDGTWLCDLGLGDALRAPLPLVEGRHEEGLLVFHLERLSDGYWRFHNHSAGNPPSFDFNEEPADETLFIRHNHVLQTDPASPFVLNAEAIMMGQETSATLLGRVLTFTSPTGVRKEILDSPEVLSGVLDSRFGISGIAVETLWPKIVARHEALFQK